MATRSFIPLGDLPHKGAIWSWGLYDLANQSFQLLINTLLFGVFVREVVAPSVDVGERWWKAMTAVSLLLVVVASPIVGAIADARAWKRELLTATGFGAAALTAALGLVGPGDAWLAAGLFIVAGLLVGLGENFLASFLPEIADEKCMGRVSAFGFILSYLGALILLAVVAVASLKLGMKETASWRPLFVFSGIWFLLFIIPAQFLLHERAVSSGTPLSGAVGDAFRRLAGTVRQARRYRQLARFMGIFFIFSLGTQVFIYLSGVITKQLGFNNEDLFRVAIELTLLAGVGAFFVGRFQDRIGHRRTIVIMLAIWTLSFLGLAAMAFIGPSRAAFYLLAAGSGIGLGGLNSSSRALVGVFTPPHKAGEFFGLWGMMFKLSGAVAMGLFLALESVVSGSTGLFLLITAGFFAVGLVLMYFVDEKEGIEAARTAQREYAG